MPLLSACLSELLTLTITIKDKYQNIFNIFKKELKMAKENPEKKETDIVTEVMKRYDLTKEEAEEGIKSKFTEGFCLSRPPMCWGRLDLLCEAYKETHT